MTNDKDVIQSVQLSKRDWSTVIKVLFDAAKEEGSRVNSTRMAARLYTVLDSIIDQTDKEA